MSRRTPLHRIRTAHFIGAGGIGVSAAAQILRARGVRCSGSDLVASAPVRMLQRRGIAVRIGPHRRENIPRRCELVIHSLAVPSANPELREARRRGIPTWSYPKLLGELMRGATGITVSGTHGKTTTTAMLAEALVAGGLDPTVVVGSLVRSLHGNARVGRSPLFLAEACEYERAFLQYRPQVIVLTTVESDHLDTYGSYTNMIRTFERYVRSVPRTGWIVANARDPGVRRVVRAARSSVVWYPGALSTLRTLGVPGAHNRSNAAGAVTAAELLGVDPAVARRAVGQFRGTWRRFEVLGTVRGVTVVDDYAHHPTAVRATIAAARERFPRRRLVVAFQPHHEHRLRTLFRNFARAFDGTDRLLLAPVYQVAGRDRSVRTPRTSADLARAVRARGVRTESVESLGALERRLATVLRRNDILLVLGAGDITGSAHRVLRFLRVV